MVSVALLNGGSASIIAKPALSDNVNRESVRCYKVVACAYLGEESSFPSTEDYQLL